MVRIQVFTGDRKQALTVPAYSVFHLFLAGWMAEICSGAPDVMDISFKILILCDDLCLFQKRTMTPCLDDPPLVEGQRAEAASAEAAAAADQAEADLRYGRNSAFFFIRGMIRPCVRKGIDIIHLQRRERLRRWILYNIEMV